MKRLSPVSVCLLAITICQLAVFPQTTQAATAQELEQALTEIACRDSGYEQSKPSVLLFQGDKLPPTCPFTDFHLIYDPQIDVIYLNAQKIDISLGSNIVGATYLAMQIRKSYLGGYLQNRGERLVAYILGEQTKITHEEFAKLRRKKPRISDPAKARVWNEHNAESMIPTNNKVASYKIVDLEFFQEPLSIEWRSYLPHCSAPTW